MATHETSPTNGNRLSRHGKKIRAGLAGLTLVLTGCAPTGEGTPAPAATAEVTSTPAPAETAEAPVNPLDAPIEGYSAERARELRSIMDLPYDDYIALPRGRQLEAFYATIVADDGIEYDTSYYDDTAYGSSIVTETSGIINGKDAGTMIEAGIHKTDTPLEIAMNNSAWIQAIQAANEITQTYEERVGRGVNDYIPSDMVLKTAAFAHHLDSNGNPMPKNTLYEDDIYYTTITSEAPDGTNGNLPVSIHDTEFYDDLDASGVDTKFLRGVLNAGGVESNATYVWESFPGPDGEIVGVWQTYEFSPR